MNHISYIWYTTIYQKIPFFIHIFGVLYKKSSIFGLIFKQQIFVVQFKFCINISTFINEHTLFINENTFCLRQRYKYLLPVCKQNIFKHSCIVLATQLLNIFCCLMFFYPCSTLQMHINKYKIHRFLCMVYIDNMSILYMYVDIYLHGI